jgi:hypothetical protein
MRTKTLLIAAAALTAAVISSQAQSTVYSQNIVGYVNTTLNGGGAYTMIANPLSNGTNGAEQVLTGLNSNGGETLYIWNSAKALYNVYIYEGPGSGTGIGFPSDFVDGSSPTNIPGDVYDTSDQVYWTPEPTLTPGQGVFIQNPNPTETNTFTGTVNTTNNTPIPGGGAYSQLSSAVPYAGNVENTNLNLTAGFNSNGGETINVWSSSSSKYYVYIYEGPSSGTGIGFPSDFIDGSSPTNIPGDVYDTSDQVYWTQPLNLNVGQGVFLQNPNSTETWVQSLNVQ